ncbi:isoprenylcysteine carboxylmethyltransferase family protein [Paraglaciecola sp. 20A4]|uniref:methyltransferase family protein n=1 Tax=Paraglaciecola sp. 20A4 TaxID=2687288 RepID=UPI00140D9675|nr:isoprenylcysteine carboxylmethyltransferase family protein [Paraglaciecola sp. 20A4]
MLKLTLPPPVVFCIAGLSMFALVGYDINADEFQFWFAGSCWFVAIVNAIFALRAFKKNRTTANPHHLERVTTLVTTGVFAYSRNPMYLSLVIMLIGWAVLLGSIWATGIIFLFLLYMTQFQIKPEERMLIQKFDSEYQLYCSNVRRWL